MSAVAGVTVSLPSDLIAAELSSLSLHLDLFAFFCKCSPNRHFPLLQEKQRLTAKFNRMDRLPHFIRSINHNLIVIWTLLQNTFASSGGCKLYAFIFCVMVKWIKPPDLIWLCFMVVPDYYPCHYWQEMSSSQLKWHHIFPKGILSYSKLHFGHAFFESASLFVKIIRL